MKGASGHARDGRYDRWGSLQGGANEAVMRDMLEIGSAENSTTWLHGKLSRKEKVMRFGHRVYKNGGSRVPTMKEALTALAEIPRPTTAARHLPGTGRLHAGDYQYQAQSRLPHRPRLLPHGL